MVSPVDRFQSLFYFVPNRQAGLSNPQLKWYHHVLSPWPSSRIQNKQNLSKSKRDWNGCPGIWVQVIRKKTVSDRKYWSVPLWVWQKRYLGQCVGIGLCSVWFMWQGREWRARSDRDGGESSLGGGGEGLGRGGEGRVGSEWILLSWFLKDPFLFSKYLICLGTFSIEYPLLGLGMYGYSLLSFIVQYSVECDDF